MKRTTKRIITISSVLVVILALLCTGVSLYINSIFDRIEKIPEVSRVDPSNEFFETDSPEESPTTAPVVKPEDIGWGEIEPFLDDKLINILLVGQDRYVGTARQRSDTMLLCSINPETKKVSMISFLRDLYVQIPGGYSDNRLNAAYAFGGFPLLVDAFYTNFGVTIDGCFEVDLAGFRSIVDILDGVDVTLTAREAEVVGVGSEEKLYHLNGKEALSYAQIRKLDSDFGRTQRQRNVTERYNKLKEAFQSGNLPDGYYGEIRANGIFCYGECAYANGETLDEYLARVGTPKSWKFPIGVSDIVDADEWLSKNDISIGKESGIWHDQIDTYIDDLDGEDVLVSVDYHI